MATAFIIITTESSTKETMLMERKVGLEVLFSMTRRDFKVPGMSRVHKVSERFFTRMEMSSKASLKNLSRMVMAVINGGIGLYIKEI